MEVTGNLSKLRTSLSPEAHYWWDVNGESVDFNELIGHKIRFDYQHVIHCVACGRETPKSFHQGFCYPCFTTRPEADQCVMNPELCRAHEGISRDMEWSKNNCLTDHYVYLAISSGLKVGVTRASQIPTRWIDQGAAAAVKIARTPNRYTAGRIEVALKEIFDDKTNWQRMLKNQVDISVDLLAEKDKAWEFVEEELQEYFIDDDTITTIEYPVLQFPEKVKSINMDKTNTFGGLLVGIKGQYLILEDNRVFNVRKHSGYLVKLTWDSSPKL